MEIESREEEVKSMLAYDELRWTLEDRRIIDSFDYRPPAEIWFGFGNLGRIFTRFLWFFVRNIENSDDTSTVLNPINIS